MLNVALTKQKLDNLAALVERRDPAAATRLRDLGGAVIGGPSADTWALSNIRAVLDPDRLANQLAGDGPNDSLTRGLEFLRNSLVLLPLAITWFGIALAVDAYYKLIGARPDLGGQSFIYLWQGGFQGRMPLPLGTLAVIDAVLLAGVFGLTLAAYARSGWVSLANVRFGAGFSRQLNDALAEAELILAPRRGAQYQISLEQLEQNAQDLLHEIADERVRISKIAQQRENELNDLDGITENLKNSSVVFLNAAQSLANTHTATLAALNAVMGTVKGLATAQQDVMKAVYNAAARLDALPSSNAPALRSASDSPRGQQDAIRNIESLIAAQQESMEKLLLEQRQALRAIAGRPAPASPAAPRTPPPENINPNLPPPPETPRKP